MVEAGGPNLQIPPRSSARPDRGFGVWGSGFRVQGPGFGAGLGTNGALVQGTKRASGRAGGPSSVCLAQTVRQPSRIPGAIPATMENSSGRGQSQRGDKFAHQL